MANAPDESRPFHFIVAFNVSLLSHPDRILAGARATVGEAEVDWAARRILWLEKAVPL